MDQHKEEERQQEEGEPTDQRREEEVAGKPDEPTDRRKEEEEEPEEGDNLNEPTGQRKEEDKEDKSGELTDQRKADAVAEELTDQRKVEVEEGEGEKETERSSGEESMSASSLSLFVHPCSLLLRYLFRAYAWCLGMADSFGGGTRPSAAPAASTNSSREEPGEAADIGTREISKTTTDRVSSSQVFGVSISCFLVVLGLVDEEAHGNVRNFCRGSTCGR